MNLGLPFAFGECAASPASNGGKPTWIAHIWCLVGNPAAAIWCAGSASPPADRR